MQHNIANILQVFSLTSGAVTVIMENVKITITFSAFYSKYDFLLCISIQSISSMHYIFV